MEELLITCNSTIHEEYPDEDLSKLKLFQDYPEGLLFFTVVCCGLYMLVGIPGNLITIIALARCKQIQNATTAFIINLACSDLLFCCFNLPIISATYLRGYWPFSMVVCRLFPMAGYGLVAVSLFTILAIMVNRYILIAYPRLYTEIYRARYVAAMIATTWIFSFGLLIPTWFENWGRFGMDAVIGSCSILPDCNDRSPKKIFFIGAFLIPCLLVLICYVRIFCLVRKSAIRFATVHKHKIPQQRQGISTTMASTDRVSSQKSPNFQTVVPLRLPEKTYITSPSVTVPSERLSSSDVILDKLDVNCYNDVEIRYHFRKHIFKRLQKSISTLTSARKPLTFQLSAKDRSLLHMIMTIIVSFWACYLPITFIKLFRDFSVPPVPRVLGYLLVYLTTCINPIIYVVMSREYRQAYKRLFSCNSVPDNGAK